MPDTAVTGLRCIRCGRNAPFDRSAYLCTACGDPAGAGDPGILDVEYDYALVRRRYDAAADRPAGVFRYLPFLPLAVPAPVLPAGNTALVAAPRLAARLGLGALLLKDETRNPTRCLKDRSTAGARFTSSRRRRGPRACGGGGRPRSVSRAASAG